MAQDMLTHNLSEPLGDATTAKVDIHAGDGNLIIDRLAGGEPVLARGTLQYFEKQGQPACKLISSGGGATLTLKGGSGGQTWFHLPWAASNRATEWQIHLNPEVSSEITAHSDGGNVKLDLAGMALTRVSADTGAGNLDIVLPDSATSLEVTATTGAGNVVVCIPSGVAARIHATTGLGKAIVDPRFNRIDRNTYQSPDYDATAKRVEVTLRSGAGNVIVNSA